MYLELVGIYFYFQPIYLMLQTNSNVFVSKFIFGVGGGDKKEHGGQTVPKRNCFVVLAHFLKNNMRPLILGETSLPSLFLVPPHTDLCSNLSKK